MLDHPYSFGRVVSRGDQQEVMNLGLAALDSPHEIVSRLPSSTRNLFSLPLVLVMVVDSGVVLLSTLSGLKHRTQLGGHS